MFRALSVPNKKGYEKLIDTSSIGSLETESSRPISLAAKASSSSKQRGNPRAISMDMQVKKASKIHPAFTIVEMRGKKKATASPQFARYLEYVKEGGSWDVNSNTPVMHYI